MATVKVDFGKIIGEIKPMNAVNNGPAGSRVRGTSNFEEYQALNIPYARLHDSAFYSGYGGEFSVDVHRIFPNFDADENDPKSYIFEPTDKYLQDIESVGTKIFYRLGAAIEHEYKKGTYPPKDFLKWAKMCEHIILHYTKGWANGFTMDIEYWEIWNEPDCTNADGTNPCWQGTEEQFIEFYIVVSKYLKEKFPHLKIGGPAFCRLWSQPKFIDDFLTKVKKENAPLDFFSYHKYGNNVFDFERSIKHAKELLVTHGFPNVETNLNEWNYVRAWIGEEHQCSLNRQKRASGAAFVASVMSVAQNSQSLDMLMYYDARPSVWNGIFDQSLKPLKTYYAFKAFDELKKIGDCAYTEREEDVYACSAYNGKEGGILLSRFDDDETLPAKDVTIELSNVNLGSVIKAEFYLLNEEKNLELTKEEFFTSERFNLRLRVENGETYLIKFVSVD